MLSLSCLSIQTYHPARYILIQNTKKKSVHLNFCSFSLTPQEAGNINRSLSCLGQVITALVDVGNGKQRHICYRDSKLTFLLRVKQITGFLSPFFSYVHYEQNYVRLCFFMFFCVMVYHRVLNIIACVTQQILLFIHPTYNSLHLLIPNSQSFPPPPTFPLTVTSLFSMSVSLFLFHRQVRLCHIFWFLP